MICWTVRNLLARSFEWSYIYFVKYTYIICMILYAIPTVVTRRFSFDSWNWSPVPPSVSSSSLKLKKKMLCTYMNKNNPLPFPPPKKKKKNISHVPCHVSRRVMCHMSRVRFFFFWTKRWSLSVEGLFSAGPTLSSLVVVTIQSR